MLSYLICSKKSKYYWLSFLWVVVTVFCSALDFAQAYLMGQIANAILGDGVWPVWVLLLVGVGYLLATLLFNWLFVCLTHLLLAKIRTGLSEDIMDSICSKDIKEIQLSYGSSATISLFTDRLEKLMDNYFYILMVLFSMIVTFAFSLIYLITLGPWYLAPLAALVLANLLVFFLTRGKTKSNLEEYIEQNKKYLGVLDAFSSFLSTAKMFSFSGRLERKTLETGKGFNAAKTKANSFSEIIKKINAFLAVCSVFSVAFIALIIRDVSPLTAGQLVSLIQIWCSICTPFFSISWFIGALMGTSGIRKGTKELLQSAKQKENIRTLNKLEAKDVSFSYDEEGVRVLDCISFAIEQKGIYLIRGASGTGKSTLCSLILKMLDPSSGNIYINGCTKLQDISEESYFRCLKALPQTPAIYPGTLKDNIVLGDDYNEKRYNNVCKMMGFEKSLLQRERNKEDEIDYKGGNLSLGELRRIGFARILYASCEWIVLDEPFASLDPGNIKILTAAILSLGETRRVILVSHEIPSEIESIATTIAFL